MERISNILVVDDDEKIRRLLKSFLASEDREIVEADCGEAAMEKTRTFSPDLVILDVQMTGMNGFETCRRLKQRFDFLPVLMVTTLTDRDSRLEGIESGADDFLSKPVDSTELRLKARNFLKMKELYDNLNAGYEALKELEKAKDDLTAFIVHDLRSPLMGIQGYLDLALGSDSLDAQCRDDLGKAMQNASAMARMIAGLLDVIKMESGQWEMTRRPLPVRDLAAAACGALASLFRAKNIRLSDGTRDAACVVDADESSVARVLQNVLSNAVRFTPEGGEIAIDCGPSDREGFVQVAVSDSGMGIPEEFRVKIFEKFGVVETRNAGARGSVGLGLTFCKMAVEAHGGRIWVEDRAGGMGAVFKFTLPSAGTARR